MYKPVNTQPHTYTYTWFLKHTIYVLYLGFFVIFVLSLLKSFKLRENLNDHLYTIYPNILINIFPHFSLNICLFSPPNLWKVYSTAGIMTLIFWMHQDITSKNKGILLCTHNNMITPMNININSIISPNMESVFKLSQLSQKWNLLFKIRTRSWRFSCTIQIETPQYFW